MRLNPPPGHQRTSTTAPIATHRGWWKPALIGFAIGVGVSQAVGIWSFASSLVHGVPVSEYNGAARIAKVFDPKGWQRVSETWEQDVAGAAGRRCVTLTLPERGLEASLSECTTLAATLRVRSGAAPKGPRLALAHPLFATEENSRPSKAPVAGWAAQIGQQATATATAEGTATTPADDAQSNTWATSTFSNDN